jgi:hypothetical protein
MGFDQLLQSLEATSFATAIREGNSLFPWIEGIHVLADTLVIGTVAIVDLRLLGLASRDRSVTRLAAEVLPFTWTAFAVAAATGMLLFSSRAVDYAHNPYLRAKLVFMALAGVNMLIFHFLGSRDVDAWGVPLHATPLRARVAGAASLLLWIGVAASGRWIGFTLERGAPTLMP